jgi:hypothetical protein
MKEFVNPWEKCPHCHQQYQNGLAIDIVTKFLSFVRRQYPDDTQRQVEALNMKLYAFDSMLNRLQPVQKREAGVTANVILSLIDRMKAEVSPLPMRYLYFKAFAYNTHGLIALAEGTEESARRAVVHFEQYLKVCEAIGDAEGIATAKSNIADAKSKYEGGNKNEEFLKASKELYEIRIATNGEDDEYTIHAGEYYAIALRQANRGEEAMELMTKLLVTSKQVLGPHHNITKQVESTLECVNNESIENDADQDWTRTSTPSSLAVSELTIKNKSSSLKPSEEAAVGVDGLPVRHENRPNINDEPNKNSDKGGGEEDDVTMTQSTTTSFGGEGEEDVEDADMTTAAEEEGDKA